MKKWIMASMIGFAYFAASPVSARTLFVDGANGNDSNSGLAEDEAKQSIGAGLAVALSGDEVLVLPGTYMTWNLSFEGKDIELRSRDGALSTIIDCNGYGRAFVFNSGETKNAVISGFTLRSGLCAGGGSIWIVDASPLIEKCIFEDNRAVVDVVIGENGDYIVGLSAGDTAGRSVTGYTARGGAVLIQGGVPCIRLCRFELNSATGGNAFGGKGGLQQLLSGTYVGGLGGNATGGDAFGGALCVDDGRCSVEQCEFRMNQVEGGYAKAGNGNGLDYTPCSGRAGGNANGGRAAGSAIYVSGEGFVDAINCVFWKNTTQGGCGCGGNGGESNQGYEWGGGSTIGIDYGGDGGNGVGGVANGGAVVGTPLTLVLKSCTFADNMAGGGIGIGGTEGFPHTTDNVDGTGIDGTGYGGAVYGGSVVNSILWGNTANFGAAAFSSTVTYSVVDDGETGVGNISDAPWLNNRTTGDLHIAYGSSAMDHADGSESPAQDMDGAVRPQLSGYDMGAYEVNDDADPPQVESITPADGMYIDRRDISIDVCFSERVQDVGVEDLVLSGSAASNAVVTAVQLIDGRYTYRFTVNELCTGTLDIRLAQATGHIKDIAGNDLSPVNWSYSVDPILVYCVRSDVSTSGDGRTWATAKKTLAEAVAVAEGRTEIWIRHGTHNVGAITISSDLRIVGGFEGNEDALDKRPIMPQPTAFLNGRLTVTGGQTIVEDVHFVDSTQQWLAAADANLFLKRCVFRNNTLTGTSRTATGTEPGSSPPKGMPAAGDSVDGIVKVTRGALRLSECQFIDNLVSGGSATASAGSYKSYTIGYSYYYGGVGGDATGGGVFGGGVSLSASTGVVYNCSFVNNRAVGGNATGGKGGGTTSGIYCYGANGGGATAGSAYGAAIFGDASSMLYIYNTLFVSNSITGGYAQGGNGGASEKSGSSGPTRCSNGGPGMGGSTKGGAVCGAGQVVLVNCTSVGNASSLGSGIGGQAGTGTYLNPGYAGSSINGTSSYGGCYGGASGSLAANSIFSQDVPNTAPTTNSHHCCFVDNPGFVWPEAKDFRLRSDSPWLDAGTNSVLAADTLDLDGDGDTMEPLPVDMAFQPRVQGDRVDLGVYEGGVIMLVVSLPSSVTEGDGLLAAVGTVSIPFAVDTDTTINLASDNTSELMVPATIVIPAGATSANFDLTVCNDALYDGTQNATVIATVPNWALGRATLNVLDDDKVLVLTLSSPIAEGWGLCANAGTVSIPYPATANLTVTLGVDTGGELTLPSTVIIPAGATSVSFDVTPIDDALRDGTQIVTMTAAASGWVSASSLLAVQDNEDGLFAFSPNVVTYNQGAGFAILTVTRTTATNAASVGYTTVDGTLLAGTHYQAASGTLQFADGQTSQTVIVPILLGSNGTFSVTLENPSAYAGLGRQAVATVQLSNGGTALSRIYVPAQMAEGEVGIVWFCLPQAAASATNLTVTTSDPLRLSVPPTVAVAAGQQVISFGISAVDDSLFNGSSDVQMTIAYSGTNVSASIAVLDNEDASLTVELPVTVPENGVLTNAGTVRVSHAVDADVTVSLCSSDTTELTVPTTVIIPAGETSATFDLTAIDDGVSDGAVSVTVIASVGGWRDGAADTSVRDVSRLANLSWGSVSSPQTNNTAIPVTLTALDQFGDILPSFNDPVSLEASSVLSMLSEMTIGTGAVPWNYPMSTYYHDARTQVIYLANEIGKAGTITSLALQVTTKPGQVLNNWTIRLRHTTLSAYPTDPVWESGWTTVRRANTTISATGWVVFTFTTPFDYNGRDNLMVDFVHDNSSYTTDGACAATTMGAYRSVTYRTDSGASDPTGWPVNGYNPTPVRSMNIPNIRLAMSRYSSNIQLTPSAVPDFVNGVWSGNLFIGATGDTIRVAAVTGDSNRWESGAFAVTGAASASFAHWLAARNLVGDPAVLLGQLSPERGLAYGMLYAFGTNMPPAGPILNIRIVNGRPMVEIPAQDPATLAEVEVRVVGTTDLTSGTWTLPIMTAANTAGKPSDRAWFEPAGTQPGKAFFRLEVGLRSEAATDRTDKLHFRVSGGIR